MSDDSALGWADERAITRLLMTYCRLLDTDVERIAAEVFTADAVVDFQGRVLTSGQAACDYLTEAVRRYRVTRHTLANVWFEDLEAGADGVTVRSNLTAWHWWHEDDRIANNLDNVVQVVENLDVVVRTADGWRISRRRTEGIGEPNAIAPARLPDGLLPDYAGPGQDA